MVQIKRSTIILVLAIVVAANTAVARIRSWSLLAAAGIVGTGVWSLIYLAEASPADPAPILFVHLVVLAALVVLWLRGEPADAPAAWRDTPSLAAALASGFSAGALLVSDHLVFAGSGRWGAALVAAMVAAAWLRGPMGILQFHPQFELHVSAHVDPI